MIAGVPARIVAPLVAAFVLFLGVVAASARRPAVEPPAAPGSRPFIARVASTIGGGYLVFLAIVFVFHDILAAQHEVMRTAASSGAVLAFGIALPTFAVLSWGEGALRRRRR